MTGVVHYEEKVRHRSSIPFLRLARGRTPLPRNMMAVSGPETYVRPIEIYRLLLGLAPPSSPGDYSYCLGASEIRHRSYYFLQVDQLGSLEKAMMSSDVVEHNAAKKAEPHPLLTVPSRSPLAKQKPPDRYAAAAARWTRGAKLDTERTRRCR